MSDRPQFQPSTKPIPGTMTRSQFDALSPHDKARAIREGWQIIDNPAGSAKPVVISKEQFESMPQAGKDLFIERGGRVENSQS